MVLHCHLTSPEGGILFLTGAVEKYFCMPTFFFFERMKALRNDDTKLAKLLVYSDLSSEMQYRIFEHALSQKRKFVMATNIAWTSLTIKWVLYVLKPGFAK